MHFIIPGVDADMREKKHSCERAETFVAAHEWSERGCFWCILQRPAALFLRHAQPHNVLYNVSPS